MSPRTHRGTATWGGGLGPNYRPRTKIPRESWFCVLVAIAWLGFTPTGPGIVESATRRGRCLQQLEAHQRLKKQALAAVTATRKPTTGPDGKHTALAAGAVTTAAHVPDDTKEFTCSQTESFPVRLSHSVASSARVFARTTGAPTR